LAIDIVKDSVKVSASNKIIETTNKAVVKCKKATSALKSIGNRVVYVAVNF
tara:strand:- start:3029 stop:3181 length:153 start_codon:yes stop_codon:yes gene_type:complete